MGNLIFCPDKGIRTFLFLLFATAGVILSGAVVRGVQAEEVEPEREPQLGILSGERRGGYEGLSVGSASEVKDAFSDERPPITGSVSQFSNQKLKASVQNNSTEAKYSISFRVIELDKDGKKLRSTPFSAVLKPGERWERQLRKQSSTAQALLDLTRAKNLTPRKKGNEK